MIATASLIGGIFGKGGGKELLSAQTLQAFVKRFGTSRGRAAWLDFREKNDPETPVTANKPFPYETGSPFLEARPRDARPRQRAGRAAGAAGCGGVAAKSGALGFDPHSLIEHSHMSNSLLVPAKQLADRPSGRGDGAAGGLLRAADPDGGGPARAGHRRARRRVPGVNQYVELGHGRDYAWSATTAGSDNIDTFAEKLCQDDFHYVWRGKCVAMEKLDRTNSWTPNPQDQTPPGSETLTVYRTVHGIVTARAKVNGQPVAYASARTTYFHEADSALGFSELNDPGFVKDAKSFQRAASDINFAFNWLYTDSEDIAYYQSGWYPQRAPRTSPDFPIFGTGPVRLARAEHGPAHRGGAAVRAPPERDQPAVHRVVEQQAGAALVGGRRQLPLGRRVPRAAPDGPDRARPAGRGQKVSVQRLVQIMDEAATQDLRGVKLLPVLLRAVGKPRDPKLAAAVKLLRAWHRAGRTAATSTRTATTTTTRRSR